MMPFNNISPFFSRWWRFICERFPLGSNLLMVAAFVTGNCALTSTISSAMPSLWRVLLTGLIVLLIFFRLRIFDEVKDYGVDQATHPDRPLSRGLLSVVEAKKVAVAVAVVEGLLALALGKLAFIGWLFVLLFSLLMYREFFIGDWLRPKMELYAVMHTIVAGWIGLFIAWGFLGQGLGSADGFYVLLLMLVNWGVFNVYEFARKTNGIEEEKPHIESYSKRWGAWGAVLLSQINVWMAGFSTYAIIKEATTGLTQLMMIGGPLTLSVVLSVYYGCHPSTMLGRIYRTGMQLYIVGFYLILAMLLGRMGV